MSVANRFNIRSKSRIKKYLTHVGLDEGIVFIPEGKISTIDEGGYLNIYKPSEVEEAKPSGTSIEYR